MSRTGRNDPCPCGSGKKYKKCCLLKEEEREREERVHQDEEMTAVQRALNWLWEHYPDEVDDAVEYAFYGGLDDDERAAEYLQTPGMQNSIINNIGEWLITDAKIRIGETETPTKELFLGPGGPLFTAAGREWLLRLGARPMSLYEARSVAPGEGMELTDLLNPAESPVWIVEKTASRSVVRGQVFGARIVERRGTLVLSGAVYSFLREEGLACRDDILRMLKAAKRNKIKSVPDREIVCTAVIAHWIGNVVRERPFPRMMDASTGEPILLVTDRYRVMDWDLLEERLAAEPDVEGNRKKGWSRFADMNGTMRRTRAALNVKPPDSLEVFCRTRKLADESRAWFEKLAGAAVVFKTREIVDPTSPKALEAARRAPKPPPPDIPPEELARVMRDFLRKHYANWADEPIPVLGDKTPRQAIKTAKGRKAVVELLKNYEHHEARKAHAEGGEPFDFTFLWEQLGLKRDEET